MPTKVWTHEERKAFGEKMRASRAAKALTKTAPVPLGQVMETPPITMAPTPRPAKTKIADVRPTPAPIPPPHPDMASILKSVNWLDLPLPELEACLGLLRDGFEACAKAREAKRAQHESLHHSTPCLTCGKKVDISRSGTYQIKTVRNPLTNLPENQYWCSAECVIYYNARQEKKRQDAAANKPSSQHLNPQR